MVPAAGSAELLYGPLFAALAPSGDDDAYAAAIELIYEGYLLHYRSSRVIAGPVELEARLLAGDYFYARGLQAIAETGDVVGVDLLSRLMASCSCLRLAAAPFACDDDLWAFTVASMAAAREGGGTRPADEFYEGFDGVLDNAAARLPGLVREYAAALPLADRRPLDEVLSGATIANPGKLQEV